MKFFLSTILCLGAAFSVSASHAQDPETHHPAGLLHEASQSLTVASDYARRGDHAKSMEEVHRAIARLQHYLALAGCEPGESEQLVAALAFQNYAAEADNAPSVFAELLDDAAVHELTGDSALAFLAAVRASQDPGESEALVEQEHSALLAYIAAAQSEAAAQAASEQAAMEALAAAMQADARGDFALSERLLLQARAAQDALAAEKAASAGSIGALLADQDPESREKDVLIAQLTAQIDALRAESMAIREEANRVRAELETQQDRLMVERAEREHHLSRAQAEYETLQHEMRQRETDMLDRMKVLEDYAADLQTEGQMNAGQLDAYQRARMEYDDLAAQLRDEATMLARKKVDLEEQMNEQQLAYALRQREMEMAAEFQAREQDLLDREYAMRAELMDRELQQRLADREAELHDRHAHDQHRSDATLELMEAMLMEMRGLNERVDHLRDMLAAMLERDETEARARRSFHAEEGVR